MTGFYEMENLKVIATMLDKRSVTHLLFQQGFSAKEMREMMGLPKNSGILSYQRKSAAGGVAAPKIRLSKDDPVNLAYLYREGQEGLLSRSEAELV